MADVLPRPIAATTGDLTRLACLWSQQELCVRRLAKVDPFAWACHEHNIDSFLLYVKLKQLPKVPTFREAVEQQRQAREEEALAARSRRTSDKAEDQEQRKSGFFMFFCRLPKTRLKLKWTTVTRQLWPVKSQ